MDNLIELVLHNLRHVGIGFVLFIICYGANMAYSIYCNTEYFNQEFDWNKIWKSVKRVLAFGIGTTLLCIGATSVPIFADYVGFEISEQYQEVFQNLAILGVLLVAACKYLIEAFSKYRQMLTYKKELANNSQG